MKKGALARLRDREREKRIAEIESHKKNVERLINQRLEAEKLLQKKDRFGNIIGGDLNGESSFSEN